MVAENCTDRPGSDLLVMMLKELVLGPQTGGGFVKISSAQGHWRYGEAASGAGGAEPQLELPGHLLLLL